MRLKLNGVMIIVRGTRVYLSGPITGTLDCQKKFSEAEERLRKIGYKVINPAKLSKSMPDGTTWEEYMLVSMAALSTADIICMLPGWERSRGAVIEKESSEKALRPVVYLNDENEEKIRKN